MLFGRKKPPSSTKPVEIPVQQFQWHFENAGYKGDINDPGFPVKRDLVETVVARAFQIPVSMWQKDEDRGDESVSRNNIYFTTTDSGARIEIGHYRNHNETYPVTYFYIKVDEESIDVVYASPIPEQTHVER